MAMEGWIKLHRQLCNHELWLSEPFTRGQAWVDLLLLANHKDGFIRVRGQRIEVKRGQVGWSQKRLAERWKWSRKKVSNFLNELEKIEHQIEQQKNRVTSIITIVNFDKYQETEQQNEQQKNNRRTTEEQQKNTNKNDKNVKNEKNVSKTVSKYTPDFETFWREYPRPKQKEKTFELWNYFLSLGVLAEDLIEAARNYARECLKFKIEERFIKYSTTFLSKKDKPFIDYLGGSNGRASGNSQSNNRENQSELDGIDFRKFEYKG